MATRGEYQIGANLTGLGTDDPDANFYENYACGSPRNYSQYCSEEVMKLFDRQSQELDVKKRAACGIAAEQGPSASLAPSAARWVTVDGCTYPFGHAAKRGH